MSDKKLHIMANQFWPVFTVHTDKPDECDDLCMPVSMSTDEYMEYLQIMVAFKELQERIAFPVPQD